MSQGERDVPGWWRALERAFHEPGDPWWRAVETAVWTLIAVSFVTVVYDLTHDASTPVPEWLQHLDHAVLVAFAVELCLRVVTWQPPELDLFEGTTRWRVRKHITGRIRYLFTPLMLIDLMAVLAIVPALRGLRALRLLRLLRGMQLFRYSSPIRGIGRALRENALLYVFSFTFLLAVVNLGGALIFLVERGSNPSIHSVSDGMWWALVTITTVGFGDITPVTGVGRIVGGALMIVGMFSLALFAGVVGTTLLRVLLNLREDQFRMASYANHIVVVGYDPSADLLLQALQQELGDSQREVIVFAPGERPEDVPLHFTWVSGDPTREHELDKAHLANASTAIIIGRRNVAPQQADATSLLVLFTIRRYLAQRPETAMRREPLYLVAEVLDPENREHARAAGADEVIETTRLGFALMAHAAASHGTGVVMAGVLSAGEHSLYIGPNPRADACTFATLAGELRESHGVIILGVRDAETGESSINPQDDLVVRPEQNVVYLAQTPCLGESESPAAPAASAEP